MDGLRVVKILSDNHGTEYKTIYAFTKKYV
jgi:hypothetical protein